MDTSTHIFTATSTNSDPKLAVFELAAQLSDDRIQFVLFFCSGSYNLVKLAAALNEKFEGVDVSGCTTAGEITSEGYKRGSITAIGFTKEHFCVQLGAVKNLKSFSLSDAQMLVGQLQSQCAFDEGDGHSFAITLVDGLSIDEEIFLATLNSALSSIPSFGGSAGDDVYLAKTHVFIQGEFHTDAAVVLLVSTDYQFEVFTTHHLKPTDTKFVVTEADPQARRVFELNAGAASEEYAQALGLRSDELTGDLCTMNPLAVKLGDRYFVRSVQSIDTDRGLTFFCAMETGLALTLMQPADLTTDLNELFLDITSRIGEPQIVIGCDCFLRRREAELKGIDEGISNLMRAFNVIGLNTYGEHFSGMHINQTFTAVAIGQCLVDE